jgi:hypothetical protein
MLSPAQRISNAPPPSWRVVVLIAWALLCAAALVLGTRGMTQLVRRAPLDGLNAQDLALLAAAISASVLPSLVAVAGWGVAMLVQAPGALTGTAIIGWVVMLALIIAGLIPAIGAPRRCPLGALRGSQSDDSRDPAATT